MLNRSDPVLEKLTVPGSPFELSQVEGLSHFTHIPASLGALIDRSRAFTDQTCFVDGDTRWTYDDVFRRSDALAGALAIEPGSRVAIVMRNSSPWMIGFLAIVRAGGVAVLVNGRGAATHLRAAVDECTPAAVLADAHYASALKDTGYAGRILEPADFPESGQALPLPAPPDIDDPAAILFTSGTTGRMKGAVLSHRNFMTGLLLMELAATMTRHNIAGQYGIDVETIIANQPQASSLLVFPLFHVSGLITGFLSQMLAGGKIVVMRGWRADDALKLIEREKISILSTVPTMLWDLLNCPAFSAHDLSSVTSVSSGGQALPLNLLEAVQLNFPGAMIGTGFGLTETSGPIAMAVGQDFLRKRASAGRVLPLANVQTRDDQGLALPPGQTGEIVVRGSMVMSGYWNRTREAADTLSGDNWFGTGDIGYIDEEGYIFIVDRKKDMVISGGENIHCAEVEQAIGEMPQIIENAAFGLPDDRWGERLVAVVVADSIGEADVQRHVETTLARHKVPVRVGFASAPLPRNDVGKIDKIALRVAWAHLTEDS